ncbi:MAG: hypothetical protein KGD63_06535 [Candidatus Lokiarchaeota archaeon]|nr:hypothetical protein [Candidatus Lokiarchaeota archaeon]
MAEKSGKSAKGMINNLGYKTVGDLVALILGLFLLLILLIDFGSALSNYDATYIWSLNWGVWTVLLMLVLSILLFPIIGKVSKKINSKIKLMPEVDEETSKRMVLFIAWIICTILLLINCVFWEDRLPVLIMYPQYHQFYFVGIAFIGLTLVILQDVIPGLNKEI